jgi:hypothetical protein
VVPVAVEPDRLVAGDLTAGINRAAGTVTPHDGTVISGITFVSDRDVLNATAVLTGDMLFKIEPVVLTGSC